MIHTKYVKEIKIQYYCRQYGKNYTSLIVVQHIWKAPGYKRLVKDFKVLNFLHKSSLVSSKMISLELLLYSKVYITSNFHTL